jgi:hypothetical protein
LPVERDGTPGFILSRALEAHGRPVAFVFDGEPPQPDGAEIVLKPALLRKSVNFKSMVAGHAYPLYYDTLFVDLRDAFTAAAATARDKKLGIWADGRSASGIAISDQATLERDAVVFPKLFPAADRVPQGAPRRRCRLRCMAGRQARAGPRPHDAQLHALRQRRGREGRRRAPSAPAAGARIRQCQDLVSHSRALAEGVIRM